MRYQDFIDSVDSGHRPAEMEPCLSALWHDAADDWHTAHQIVQQQDGRMAALIHAYLHRKEGDDWNARYWHRQAGSTYPDGMSLEQEWEQLVRQLLEA